MQNYNYIVYNDYALTDNFQFSFDKFNNYFKIFEIYTLNNEKVDVRNILSNAEYISDKYGYYYNIYLSIPIE
ncbi:MAG: hypothetical protein OCD02_13195 [Spirochaetaceae bacterium]